MAQSKQPSWHLPTQQKDSLPPGMIASAYGIRGYYTVQVPNGIPSALPSALNENLQPPHANKPTKAEAGVQCDPQPANIQAYQGADPIQSENYRRSPTLYSTGSLSDGIAPVPNHLQADDSSPVTAPNITDKDFDERTVITEDFYNALSRHQSDPTIQPADSQHKRRAPNPDTTEEVRLDNPKSEKKRIPRKAKSLPDLNQRLALINQHQGQVEMHDTQLPRITAAAPIIPKTGSHVLRTVMVKKSGATQPVFIVQNEEDSEDDSSDSESSKHYYYGPNNKRLPGPPPSIQNSSYQSNNLRLPYLLPPINPKTSITNPHQRRRQFRMHAHLEYGDVVDNSKATELPDSVHKELMKEYGHMEKTEVVIVKRNGNYSIHSRPQRRKTSNGFILTQSQLYSDDDMNDIRE